MGRRKNGTVENPDLVLWIRYDEASNNDPYYCNIVGGLRHEKENINLEYESIDGIGKYKGVTLTSQSSRRYLADPDNRFPMYALELEWYASHMNASACKLGAATLGMLDKKLDKITEEYGPPASFGVWVWRVCKVIGLDKVQMPERDRDNFVTPGIACEILDHKVWSWQELARKKV